MKQLLALCAAAAVAASASAGIVVETYGAAAPPRWMGDGLHYMRPAAYRGDLFTDVTETDGGLNRITFSSPVSIRAIGAGWASWSHGYTGNCYYSNGLTSLVLTMSSGIRAFQFYAEPNPFGVFQMTATGSDGPASIASDQWPDGSSGASGWGFYTTGPSDLVSVRIAADVDFAVGEFATGWLTPPAPPGLAALGLAALVSTRRRR